MHVTYPSGPILADRRYNPAFLLSLGKLATTELLQHTWGSHHEQESHS